MDELILNLNLKYVLAALDMTERGELLTALFEGTYTGSNQAVHNVYHYIVLLQQEAQNKKQRMRELSAKGVAARQQLKKLRQQDGQQAELSSGLTTVNQRLLRKETKESRDKYNLNLFSDEKSAFKKQIEPQSAFVPPTVPEVQEFIQKHGFSVNAENFVDFYESHGWMVGSTPIRSWKATLRLWQSRAQKGKAKAQAEDETYWHDLKQRVTEKTSVDGDILQEPVSLSKRQNVAPVLHHVTEIEDEDCSPFARFMRRVEKYDINLEKNNDK